MNIKDFFSAPNKKYGSKKPPLNPAERAKQAWDEREGMIVVQNYNLRRIILGMTIALIALAIGLTLQSLKSTVSPYIVEVDSTTGMVRNVGLVEEQQYVPQQAVIEYFLSEFIKNIREIPLDPVVYQKKGSSAYAFMTKDAALKMEAQLQNENPLQHLGKKTIQVNILVSMPMSDGSNSYQVRWTEEEFQIGSGKKITTPMSGVFTITHNSPKDKETSKINPLGLYISDFNWSTEAVLNKENQK